MKIRLYFYHEQWVGESEGAVAVWPCKFDDELTGHRLRVYLCDHEVDVPDVQPLPEAEIKNIMVTGLRQQAKDLQAETHMNLAEIDGKIQQLLCLENKGGNDEFI